VRDTELDEAIDLMRNEREKVRGYANYFTFESDRDLEEFAIVDTLNEAIKAEGEQGFTEIRIRGRGEDPPDCEAMDSNLHRVAIEITELVDGNAIRATAQTGLSYSWAEWTEEKFTDGVSNLINRKNDRFPSLLGTPYEGGYELVIFTDEPMLDIATINRYLPLDMDKPEYIDNVYILLSYDPSLQKHPYIKLEFNG